MLYNFLLHGAFAATRTRFILDPTEIFTARPAQPENVGNKRRKPDPA